MKYLVSCLIALPFITSCVVQEEYYEPGYYAPPPPPRVEVHPNHNHGYYRPAAQARVYHNRPGPRGSAVVVTPRGPRARVEVQGGHRNVVRNSQHSESRVEVDNSHGHNGTVITRSHSETNVQVRRKVEGHGNNHEHGNEDGHP